MIDLYDFNKTYSPWTNSNEEMHDFIRYNFEGMDELDIEQFKTEFSDFSVIPRFGKFGIEGGVSFEMPDGLELKYEIFIDRLKDDLFVLQITNHVNILYMKIFDQLHNVTAAEVREGISFIKERIIRGQIYIPE